MTPTAQQALFEARDLARQDRQACVEGGHLLRSLLQVQPEQDSPLRALIERSGLKWDEVQLYAQSAIRDDEAPQEEPEFTQEIVDIVQGAEAERRSTHSRLISTSHVFIACFRPNETSHLAEVLAQLGVSADQLRLHLTQLNRAQAANADNIASPLAQLDEDGEHALEAAHAAMRASNCGRISTLHLLLGVLENAESDAVSALQTLMIDADDLRRQARAVIVSDGQIAGPERKFMPATKRALDRAKSAAREGGRTQIGSADLLMGLLPQPAIWVEKAQFGAQPDDPAAPILRDVNYGLVGAIFSDAPAPIAQTRAAPSPLALLKSPAFLVFALQLLIGLAMRGLSSHMARSRPLILALFFVLVGAILLSALLAIVAQIFFQDPRRKSIYLSAFAGALAGAVLAMAIAGKP